MTNSTWSRSVKYLVDEKGINMDALASWLETVQLFKISSNQGSALLHGCDLPINFASWTSSANLGMPPPIKIKCTPNNNGHGLIMQEAECRSKWSSLAADELYKHEMKLFSLHHKQHEQMCRLLGDGELAQAGATRQRERYFIHFKWAPGDVVRQGSGVTAGGEISGSWAQFSVKKQRYCNVTDTWLFVRIAEGNKQTKEMSLVFSATCRGVW